MSLGAQLPIRLDPDVQEKFEAIARQVGTSKSALLRLLARTFVEQVVDAEGRVHLPPDWNELLRRLPAADGRTCPAEGPARAAGRRPRQATPAQGAPSKPDAAAAMLLRQHLPSAPEREPD
jgi:hypothetical protein